LRGDLITQRGQRRARAIIGDNALPFGVAIQFRQDGRQVIGQALALGWRQCLDGGFNFSDGAHYVDKLLRRERVVK